MIREERAVHLPGRMTAVMRAVSVVDNRPRVLRIAIVEAGRVAEERIVQANVVTIGSAEDATFVLRGAGRRFRLFERDGSRWRLRLQRGMAGRVALASGVTDVAALGDGVALDDAARGKIVIGAATVLFQLVPLPPIRPRPQLPIAVTGGIADRIDWSLTIVAALSFLFHFGVVGAMYSDWMDPVVDGRDVSGLVDLTRVLTPDLPVETRPAEPGTATPSNEPVAKKERSDVSHPSPGKATAPSRPGAMSDARAAELAARVDAMQMGMVVAVNGGPATRAALDRSEIPPVDMSSAAASRAAVATANGDLKTPAGGDPHVHKGDLATLVAGTKKTGPDRAGDENPNVAPPIPTVMTLPPTAPGTVSDADVVVARLRPRFRKCYQDGLSGDPTMHGKVVLAAHVGANGEVSSVDVASNSGLSQGVASCLQAALGRAEFKSNGAPATIRVPVALDHQ
jgi:hypothetical protein